MRMRWHDLCFLHWRVDPARLAPLLPAGLTLDTFDDAAWIGVVPFRMSDVSVRLTPRVRRLADFAELNVRTYVTAAGKPGVWFFSLDATQPVAVRVARSIFHLPYHDARITLRRDGDSYAYASTRPERHGPQAALTVGYRPTGPAYHATPGTVDHFLIERYCLYTTDRSRRPLRQEVDHVPWSVQPAAARVVHCTVTEPFGIPLDGPPIAHFSASLDVVAWRQQRVTGPRRGLARRAAPRPARSSYGNAAVARRVSPLTPR